MLFQKTSFPVINAPSNCFQIMKEGTVYEINCTKKDFEKNLEFMVKKGILDWEDVSAQSFFTNNISEEFMRKHVEDLDWWKVTNCTQLSKSFLREIIELVDWNWVIHNQKFYSKDMLREFKDRANYVVKDGEEDDLETIFSRLVVSVDE